MAKTERLFQEHSPRAGARRDVLALAALVASLSFATNSAHAGCGDYVIHGTAAATETRTAPALEAQAPAQPVHGRIPCRGPHCSANRPIPLAPPMTVTSYQIQEWACVAEGSAVPEGHSSSTWSMATSLCRLRLSLDIFHPPRIDSVLS
jgi:hypothetical protein